MMFAADAWDFAVAIVAAVASVVGVIVANQARRHASSVNDAINHVYTGTPRLKDQVDELISTSRRRSAEVAELLAWRDRWAGLDTSAIDADHLNDTLNRLHADIADLRHDVNRLRLLGRCDNCPKKEGS